MRTSKALMWAATLVAAIGLSAVAVSAATQPSSLVMLMRGAQAQRLPRYFATTLIVRPRGKHAGRRREGSAAILPTVHLSMNVMPGMKLGPDGRLHDAFSPSTLSVSAGQKVILTVYNWDSMPHSFTSTALHVNVILPRSPRKGQPSVTTIPFVAPKAPGPVTFRCIIPCDTPNHGWSMSHAGYMIGAVNVEAVAS